MKITEKIQILVRQREEGLYAQVAAGNLLLVLASWPISYTQDKTRQYLSLFLSFFFSFFLSFFSFSPVSYTQDKTKQHLSLFLLFTLFISLSFPNYFLLFLVLVYLIGHLTNPLYPDKLISFLSSSSDV